MASGVQTYSETGIVDNGAASLLVAVSLADGSSITINEATLLLSDGQGVPTSVDLVLASFSSSDSGATFTKEGDIITGDGSAKAGLTGDPLFDYSNGTGGSQFVAILVDNGHFGAGSGSDQSVIAGVEFEVGETQSTPAPTGFVVWEDQDDWDNATSNTNSDASSGVLTVGRGIDSFEDLSDGDPLPSGYENNNTDGIDSSKGGSEGSLAVESYAEDSAEDISGDNQFELSGMGDYQPDVVKFAYRELGSAAQGVSYVLQQGGSDVLACGTSNPGVGYFLSGDGNTSVESSPTPNYDAWRLFTFEFDWGASTVDVTWEDIDGSTPTYTRTGISFSFTGFDNMFIGDGGYNWGGGGDNSGSGTWFDQVWGAYTSSSLTTATKSFGEAVEPDLADLDYTLNGETISLDIVGSPGTGNEETLTQELTGSTSFDLTWASAHEDFRLKIDMDSVNRGSTPEVNSLKLIGS